MVENSTIGAPEGAAGAASVNPCAEDMLNSDCVCSSLDQPALENALELEFGRPGLFELITARCPNLFSVRPVFVSATHRDRMAAVVRAIDSVVALPTYRETVLAWAPPIARFDPGGAQGVLFGYDFHISGDRVGLIEINTNAGGATLNVALARAQRACCKEMEHLLPSPTAVAQWERNLVAMFQNEWRASGRSRPLRTLAIVDETPEQQFLYPEFLLFQRLFERHGVQAVIAAPCELSFREGVLMHDATAIDLVYNRLTDFSLQAPMNAALREAYLQQSIVLTPHPRAHALYADKRNLALLSDGDRLAALGVDAATRAILIESIPRTESVTAANAQRLWSERRSLFFKPTSGFGSRAAYRGDKLTQRVWKEILAGDYVAQQFVPPGERIISKGTPAEPAAQSLKFDVRNYVYGGQVEWLAARLYQGQTTNFRTPGGGFAAIYTSSQPVNAASA
jgi:hypothetical protein